MRVRMDIVFDGMSFNFEVSSLNDKMEVVIRGKSSESLNEALSTAIAAGYSSNGTGMDMFLALKFMEYFRSAIGPAPGPTS